MNESNDVEMVRMAFRTLDKDGSGTVETAEFKHLMTHIGRKGTILRGRNIHQYQTVLEAHANVSLATKD